MAGLESSVAVHGAPNPARAFARQVWRSGGPGAGRRMLAEEVPVAFAYDGAAHAVMMATPDDLLDFAIGFSLTEGVIRAEADLADVDIVSVTDGIMVRMWLTEGPSDAFAGRRRHYVGPAGCGMCGLDSLAEAVRAVPVVRSDLALRPQEILDAVSGLPPHQKLNAETHAVHAAAFVRRGCGMVVREDVGRHNALDKLAGALAHQAIPAREGMVVLSSRISVELVQKAAMIGAPVLVAMSAPTAMAIRVAESSRITLVGIARGDGFEVFTHPERIRLG